MAPLAVAASDSALIPASDLRAEASEAVRYGEPLLVLYSRPSCPYCDEVRNIWLLPLSRDAKYGKLKIRQIDQDSDRPLIDFAGRATTHARFAASEKVSLVPVVAVYGPSGQRLAEAIVGLRLRDFYGAYLDAQLDEARAPAQALKPADAMFPEKLPHQRPELPDFWEQRFRCGSTPWDAGRAPQALQDFAQRYEVQRTAQAERSPPRVLIPGCGSAWDAAFLDRRGWDVSALDFSAAALDVARASLGAGWRGKLLCADFFSFRCATPFDIVYERAFLCALPRKLWPAYAPHMAGLLFPGGRLAGTFYFSEAPQGPPFGILRQQLEGFLAPYFSLLEDDPVEDSLPVFAGRERWQVWQRKSP